MAVTMRELLEAGVHFGHQTRRWNPKMRPYIFTERNGIHIVDLRMTVSQAERAYDMVKELATKGGTVLFVGTKKQAQEAVRRAAEACDMPYVNHRWLGGMLTNFQTIHRRIMYMRELERMDSSGEMDALPKKERLRLRRPRVLSAVDPKEREVRLSHPRRIPREDDDPGALRPGDAHVAGQEDYDAEGDGRDDIEEDDSPDEVDGMEEER